MDLFRTAKSDAGHQTGRLVAALAVRWRVFSQISLRWDCNVWPEIFLAILFAAAFSLKFWKVTGSCK